ncbi:hypothetical protein GQ53DRAFT_740572 [Thozetella sp. PMI_491]|nr:hypothetical protein GQ53DRAFT_740572 [Thozetella sp. PMI_491]
MKYSSSPSALFLLPALAWAASTPSFHLVGCTTLGTINPAYGTVVLYCADDANCDQSPAGENVCLLPGREVLTPFEGDGSCTFSTGVTFNWHVDSGALEYTNYTLAGSGSNGTESFLGYKDDFHLMYETLVYPLGWFDCLSYFYFLPQ